MSIDNINKLFVDCSVGMNMGHGTWDSGTPAAGTRYLQLPGAGLSHNLRFVCSYLLIIRTTCAALCSAAPLTAACAVHLCQAQVNPRPGQEICVGGVKVVCRSLTTVSCSSVPLRWTHERRKGREGRVTPPPSNTAEPAAVNSDGTFATYCRPLDI